MLGLDNPIHILVLLVIVLLVFGAKRLPEMGKSLGEGLRGFKDSVSGEPSIRHMTPSEHSPAEVDQLPQAAPRLAEPTGTGTGTAEWTSEPRDGRTPIAPAA